HGVELVGYLPDLAGQIAHDGDTTGVVGDRPEGVERDDDSRHGEHAHDGDPDTVEAAEVVAEQDGNADETDWERSRMLPGGKSGDDVGGVTGFRRFRDPFDRPIAGGGVVVGDNDDHPGHQQPDKTGQIEAVGVVY